MELQWHKVTNMLFTGVKAPLTIAAKMKPNPSTFLMAQMMYCCQDQVVGRTTSTWLPSDWSCQATCKTTLHWHWCRSATLQEILKNVSTPSITECAERREGKALPEKVADAFQTYMNYYQELPTRMWTTMDWTRTCSLQPDFCSNQAHVRYYQNSCPGIHSSFFTITKHTVFSMSLVLDSFLTR